MTKSIPVGACNYAMNMPVSVRSIRKQGEVA